MESIPMAIELPASQINSWVINDDHDECNDGNDNDDSNDKGDWNMPFMVMEWLAQNVGESIDASQRRPDWKALISRNAMKRKNSKL